MAQDPANQQQFIEDVAAAEAAGNGEGYANMGDAVNGKFEMPSVDEVWKLIEQMDGITDEERADLRESLYNPKPGSADRFGQPQMGHTSFDYLIFFAMIVLIVLVFALFGFKLYKSLMEKEVKKQEKLKAKQSKKAKKAN